MERSWFIYQDGFPILEVSMIFYMTLHKKKLYSALSGGLLHVPFHAHQLGGGEELSLSLVYHFITQKVTQSLAATI